MIAAQSASGTIVTSANVVSLQIPSERTSPHGAKLSRIEKISTVMPARRDD
jgi:hypothetical protein